MAMIHRDENLESEVLLLMKVGRNTVVQWEHENPAAKKTLLQKGYVKEFGKGQEMLILTELGESIYQRIISTYKKD